MTKNEKVKPIVRWPGGKTRMLKYLLPRIPEHETYIEVFGGGLALFCAKKRSPLEVVNDINSDLIALYLCVQKHLPELTRQINQMVCSRKLLSIYSKEKGITDIERAARFWFCNRISFGADGRSFGVTKKRGSSVAFTQAGILERFNLFQKRLDGTVIENLPWGKLVATYDQPESFFFFDPPYIGYTLDYYDPFTETDMSTLESIIRGLKGKWLLTVNDSPFTRSLFKRYTCLPVTTMSQTARNGKGKDFGELIITK